MGKKKRGVVEQQEINERGGSSNSYERYSAENGESVLGNPDLLPEQSHSPSNPQMIMGEAVEHLQGRQKEVYLMIMRDEKTQEETAEALDLSRASVRTYFDRAIAFISAYCKSAIDGGRV